MHYTSPIVLALILVAPACSDEKCGTSDRGCVDVTETASATDGTPTGSTGTPTTEPTTGTPGELLRCKATCTADTDCTFDGTDIGFTCVDGECGLPSCTSDEGCRTLLSGWSEPCTMTAECFMGEACIVHAGDGRCATQPGPGFACADFGLVEVTKPALEGGDVTVCGNIDATCKDAACIDPCSSDADCPAERGAPHCSLATGECQCTADAECQATMQPGFNVCLDGRCGCSSDADCAGGTNVDTCVAGSCGCSSSAACTDPVFDNVTQVCEAA
jgi:hypothetical protein